MRIYLIKYESKYQATDRLIEGKLIKYTKTDYQYTLTIKGKEKIKVNYPVEEDLNLKFLGMQLQIKGSLSLPYQNTIPGNFNYRDYLKHQQIYYIMQAETIIIKSKQLNLYYQLKNYLYQRIQSFKYTSAYLKTFILGDKADFDQDIYMIYQNNGIAHLFAISGMHINLLTGICLFGLKKIKMKETYSSLLVISFLLFYLSFTNFSASIMRSIWFFILIKLNKLWGLQIKTKDILFLTCSTLILIKPLIIFDLGFQYSAIITLGLILTSKYCVKGFLKKLLLTSIFAFLFSLPITISHWYELNLLGIVNNLIMGPLIGLVIYPGCLITLLIKYLEPLLYLLIKLMEILNIFLNEITVFQIIIPKVNLVWYLLYYLLLFIFLLSNNKKYLMMSLFLVLSFKLKYYFDPQTYLYFLDVGQGDSTLIYNRQEVILVDTGGLYNYQISDNTIILLKSLGITKIDLLLLTHGDADHLGDAINIIDKFKVKSVMLNGNVINELEMAIINHHQNIVEEYQSSFDLNIFREDNGEDENASSIITLLTLKDKKILLMGDAPKAEEQKLIRVHEFKVDLIKLGHHGSKTSSDPSFLKAIGVKEAIISSGRNNKFKHPSIETIETLEDLGINYYNTAEFGTIKYTFRQSDYTKATYPP